MEQRRAVSAKLAAKYRSCKGRAQRAAILQQVVELTGYVRHYAAWLLRNLGKTRVIRTPAGEVVRLVVGRQNKRRPTVRKRTYDQAVKKVVVLLWESFDQMCGKRLAAILPDVLSVLFKRKGLAKSGVVYQKLRRISAATIDRLLSAERAKRRLKGMAHTTPSHALKSRIPILISSELPVEEPGHFQIDLVGHEGGNPNGHFAFTLDAVELYSGWVEPRILQNKAQIWVKKALESVKDTTPLPIKSLHSDNDSAFINEPLQSWCQAQHIAFSRSRPWHSNDTCYVEQKNYNIVRQAIGYPRYETEEEVVLIATLYEKLRLLINFFYPSMKLLQKRREGARIHKTYDKACSPARRLLRCPTVPEAVKRELSRQMRALDPFVLKGQIARIQGQLLEMVRKKSMKILYPGPPYPQAKQMISATLFGESYARGIQK
jgi:hypothetical protein